jgi:peptidoglycan/xylan/chitin deacetylase (PgdA/CDA1 family)
MWGWLEHRVIDGGVHRGLAVRVLIELRSPDQAANGSSISRPHLHAHAFANSFARHTGSHTRAFQRLSLAKTIYLTFDDGPNPTWTPEILSLLEESGAQATFFVIGEKAKAWPGLVEREARDGDTVGDHTWSHPDLTELSASTASAELAMDKNLITVLTGERRPACGDLPTRASTDRSWLLHQGWG